MQCAAGKMHCSKVAFQQAVQHVENLACRVTRLDATLQYTHVLIDAQVFFEIQVDVDDLWCIMYLSHIQLAVHTAVLILSTINDRLLKH